MALEPGNSRRSLKDLCVEDKARVGQLVQKIALERASRKNSEERAGKETSDLNKLLEKLKHEQVSLLRESENIQESLATSMSQIESLHNSQVMHSVENPAKTDCSVSVGRESCEISIQTFVGETASEKESKGKRYLSDDMKKIIDKAQETSARLERFFSSTNSSINESFRSDRVEKIEGKDKGRNCGGIGDRTKDAREDDRRGRTCEKGRDGGRRGEEEMVVIEDVFYDGHILDVIDMMEDFED